MDDFEEGIFIGFTARVYDKANNYTNFDYDNTILWVDTTSPEIQNVTSLNTAKAYGAEETIYISVKTNEEMRAVGAGASNSTLELATGQTADLNPLVPFRSVSNDTVYYTYTTQAGESSEDDDPTLVTTADRLKYAATTSLAIDGGDGVLTDLAGNNLGKFLTPGENFWPYLPDLDSENSLDQMINIIIDTDPPGVTFTYFEGTTETPSDGLVSVNNTELIIRATFTDSISYDPAIPDNDPTLHITLPPHLRTGTKETITNERMVRTGKWQYDYSLTLIDAVHSTSPEENLFISPTAYDKANNPIHPFPGITATVIDSSIVEMDNVEPKFLIVDIEGETPNITELAPGSNSFINSREVAYELSEDLASGKIIWSAKFGSTPEDPNVPDDGYEVSLVGNELLASDNDNNAALHELTNGGPLVLTLKDSAQYTVTSVSYTHLTLPTNREV